MVIQRSFCPLPFATGLSHAASAVNQTHAKEIVMSQAAASASSSPGKAARIARVFAITGLALAIACGIAELLAGLGYRWGWWHFRTGLQVMRWAASTDLAAVAMTLIATGLAIKVGTRGTLVAAIHGLVLSVIVAGPPLYMYREASNLPRIHDISTDTQNPPAFSAVMPMRKGAENSTTFTPENARLQQQGYPDIAPVMLDAPPVQAFARAERAARAMGWDIVAAAPANLRIEATDTTLLFGFKDDVVIRVSANGAGSRVDVRSLSRVGRSDFGTNAKRIRLYVQQLANTPGA